MKRLILILAFVVFWGSCSTDDASDIVLFVTPSSMAAKGSDKVFYDIYAKTIHEYVATVTVTSFDSENGERQLMEETPCTMLYEKRFTYTAPDVLGDSLNVLLEFIAIDDLGHRIVQNARLRVMGAESMVEDTAGPDLCSQSPGKQYAFPFPGRKALR